MSINSDSRKIEYEKKGTGASRSLFCYIRTSDRKMPALHMDILWINCGGRSFVSTEKLASVKAMKYNETVIG